MILGLAVAPRRVICRTGDMAIGMTAQKAKELENLAGPWIHNARECRVGDYLVDAPDRQGSPELFVSRTGLPVLAVADQPLKEQVKVGDRWLDYVTREGRSGVVLDGKFMSPAAARKEVAARGNAIE
jgi:hypothetical protein